MAHAYYIPNGIENLKLLFPGLDWDNITEYYLEIMGVEETILATTTVNKVTKLCDTDIRLHFQNYAGGIDSAIFHKINVDNDSKSDQTQTPVSNLSIRRKHGVNRGNIKANEFYRGEYEYDEIDMDWLMELFNSPFVWMEWNGTQYQLPDYIPVVVLDAKTQKFKREERFYYIVTIDFALSHDKTIIRG